MRFEVDIQKRMRCGKEEFLLCAAFETSDSALVLFGPSGSGKTLTLQAVAGILTPDSGCIRLDGRAVFDSAKGINVPARKRNVGYVFQDYALFPHLSVRDNIGFGLKPLLGRLTGADHARVAELMDVFGLTGVAGQKPSTLSGGQQQRTALARALATSPQALLLDEPLSALDQPLRIRMREELSRILRTFDIPMVMVTHDSDEAQAFAESVVVYRNGSVTGMHSAREMERNGHSLSEAIQAEVALAYE
ncbi:ABC transporter ATP-binding protein [Pseudodesulfovibrio portus]|uniref:Molybdenum ABC transporter ATPase n=1 Tax=Pseudodesulfovibrio portus TaxID=231439 RepID=A0ABN6RTN6_9BACT|nr:ABC transporter ATP-binding protein [Pseudodesulfovibrio portus]BDQ34489.1 molybdenum ABC transporter ATPase [Pseudodesulfovibrio portus]